MCAYLRDVGAEHNLLLMGRNMNKENEVAPGSCMLVHLKNNMARIFTLGSKLEVGVQG